LVIALGRQTIVPELPGLRERALTFQSAGDAVALRNHLIDAVELAHNTTDPEERRARLTFVVSGGGDTGVELAATIRECLSSVIFTNYPGRQDAYARVVLLSMADRLVPRGPPKVSALVKGVLEKPGVDYYTGVSVKGASDGLYQTSQGALSAYNIFWAAG